MKKVSFVSTNAAKALSMRRVCTEHGIDIEHIADEVPEPQVSDLSFIAREKARYAFGVHKKPLFCQDSGFFLEAFPGFPGPFVKFTLDTLGLDGYLALCEGRSRNAWFEECIAFADGLRERSFTSRIPGSIAQRPSGTLPASAWSHLWLIFIPEGYGKTLAEMTETERADWRLKRGNTSAQDFARWYASQ